LDDDLEKAKGLRIVLSDFEKLSGLKINFHKSELFCFGETRERTGEYVELFGCKEGEFPFRYLGIPMSPSRIHNKDWRVVEERFQKKLSSWKGKLLSSGGRLVLINSVLSSLPMFMMSFFRIPKGVLEKLDYYRSRFFGNVMSIERSIGWPNGAFFINLGVLGGWVLLIWISKINAC
jgi:hypothetical protein